MALFNHTWFIQAASAVLGEMGWRAQRAEGRCLDHGSVEKMIKHDGTSWKIMENHGK